MVVVRVLRHGLKLASATVNVVGRRAMLVRVVMTDLDRTVVSALVGNSLDSLDRKVLAGQDTMGAEDLRTAEGRVDLAVHRWDSQVAMADIGVRRPVLVRVDRDAIMMDNVVDIAVRRRSAAPVDRTAAVDLLALEVLADSVDTAEMASD